MNRRQQKYFLLGMILLSFLLLGQFGEGEDCHDCFGLREGTKENIHSLADRYYDVFVRINKDVFGSLPVGDECGGAVTPMMDRIVDGGNTGFTVSPGACKSMNVSIMNTNPTDSGVLSSISVQDTTIIVQNVRVDQILRVDFYDDCKEARYQFLPSCLHVDSPGTTPVILDGEIAPGIGELPEDEVHPEPEPDLEPIGTACWASGAACSPAFSTDSRCCSGYCADGGCL